MIIPNIWENKKCSKPPTRILIKKCYSTFMVIVVVIPSSLCVLLYRQATTTHAAGRLHGGIYSSNKRWDIDQNIKCQVIQLAVTNSTGGQSKKKQVSMVSTHKNTCLPTTIYGSSATMFCLLLHHLHPTFSEIGYLKTIQKPMVSHQFPHRNCQPNDPPHRRRHPKGKRLCFRKA